MSINFNKPYNRTDFTDFLRHDFLTDSFETKTEEIPQYRLDYKYNYINKITYIGHDRDLNINIYEIEHESEHDPRVSLTKETFRLMAELNHSKSLAVFKSRNSDNYRFSFISVDLKEKEGKVVKEFSNPRRYSFFLGPQAKIHTPEQFLRKKGRVKNLEDLEERFSVEVVNKEFYKKIALLFTKIAGGKRKINNETTEFSPQLKLPSVNPVKDHEVLQEFAVRLIGRIIFIWFLKKKTSKNGNALLPFNLLSSRHVKKYINEGSDYYHEFIEPLFFEVLNTKLESRKEKFRDDYFDQIPFLNGGLFSPHKNDYYLVDKTTNYSKYLSALYVPNKWLKELVSVLETYNFTIDENTPIDVELSVDPEMLGRIFENLLAEINPESGESAKKATGSYYTPREIVEFMVDESIKEYLKTKTNIENFELEKLFSYYEDDLPLGNNQKETVIEAISKLKVFDPACGSGAFPMGILNKCNWIIEKLDPNAEIWINKQCEKLDSIPRKIFKEKIRDENPNYIRKLGLIESTIYGVDIQEIAVEIAKLRVFLSLIVDAKINNDNYKNRGIKSLPNLEFKFVCANSIVGLEETKQKKLETSTDDNKILQLKKLREDYFISWGSKKLEIEQKYLELQNDISEQAFNLSITTDSGEYYKNLAHKLSHWNPFNDEPVGWFDPEWMFGIKKGFDILISNPPYIKEYTNKDAFNNLKNSEYYKGKMDIWYLFACKGLDMLKEKGILTFIAQNNWVTSYGASILRKKVISETQILCLVDFGDVKVFDSGIQTMIMIFKKNSIIDNYEFDYRRLKGKNNTIQDAFNILQNKNQINTEYLKPKIKRKKLEDKTLSFNQSYIESVLEKISKESNFKFNHIEIANGIHHHHARVNKKRKEILNDEYKIGDGIFVLSNAEKEEIPFNKKELELIKPSYTSEQLFRWYGDSNNSEWVIYTDSSFKNETKISEYPNIKKHLDQFKNVITSDNGPYGLHRSKDERFFKGEKIIALRKCEKPTFTYVDFDSYVSASFYLIKTNRINLLYLTALLNSSLIMFWLKHKGKLQGMNFQIDKEPLLNLPLKQPTISIQNKIIEVVKKIITCLKNSNFNQDKKINTKLEIYEKEIDKFIYKIYNLTEEEILIIEQSLSEI